MFDFLDKPVVSLLIYAILALLFLFDSITDMPERYDENNVKRKWYERWKGTPWKVRWTFIAGCASAIVAVISLLELLGLVKIVGP